MTNDDRCHEEGCSLAPRGEGRFDAPRGYEWCGVAGPAPANNNDGAGRQRAARAALRRARAARRRGLTLVEVLLVVSLVGLIGAAIVAPIFTQGEKAKVKIASTAARQLHASAEQWVVTHEDAECPSLDRLVSDGAVSESANLNDPWGKPFRIVCETGRVRVLSSGPDRKDNTGDDIRVPTPRAAVGG